MSWLQLYCAGEIYQYIFIEELLKQFFRRWWPQQLRVGCRHADVIVYPIEYKRSFLGVLYLFLFVCAFVHDQGLIGSFFRVFLGFFLTFSFLYLERWGWVLAMWLFKEVMFRASCILKNGLSCGFYLNKRCGYRSSSPPPPPSQWRLLLYSPPTGVVIYINKLKLISYFNGTDPDLQEFYLKLFR